MAGQKWWGFLFFTNTVWGIFQQQSITAPDVKVEKYEIAERLLPLKMSREHISVGCFGDENFEEYFNFKTVAFVSRGCDVLVVRL